MHREFWCGNPKQEGNIFRPRLRLKDGIKTDLKEHYRRFESGLSGSAKAHMTPVLNTLMNLWISKMQGLLSLADGVLFSKKRILILDIFRSDNN
jgi:hypothetical protein